MYSLLTYFINTEVIHITKINVTMCLIYTKFMDIVTSVLIIFVYKMIQDLPVKFSNLYSLFIHLLAGSYVHT